ncbi:hypothetical protein [Actinosynnema sp. NPDC023587]
MGADGQAAFGHNADERGAIKLGILGRCCQPSARRELVGRL